MALLVLLRTSMPNPLTVSSLTSCVSLVACLRLTHPPRCIKLPAHSCKRQLHDMSSISAVASTVADPASTSNQGPLPLAPSSKATSTPKRGPQPQSSPLSVIPFPTLVRSYFITSLSTSPLLLPPSLRLLSTIAQSRSRLLNPDTNPLLRWVLKKTFYAQFCAGETAVQVKNTVAELRRMGFEGVILGYAKECEEAEVGAGADCMIAEWKIGTLKTVDMAERGDMVALKFTGAGSEALHDLTNQSPPSRIMREAIVEICELAKERGVLLLFDAEQSTVQPGIDAWTMDFMRKYNGDIPGKALIYGTYQAYLRSTSATLARHLEAASLEGFTLGIKLVRGAYLGSDPRHLFWSSKEETDQAYNGIAEALMKKKYGGILTQSAGTSHEKFPDVNVVLASHNLESVQKAMRLRKEQLERKEERIELAYGQLQGMADYVSCELIQAGRMSLKTGDVAKSQNDKPRVFKYVVWGTVRECLKYLLRRAEENRSAIVRTEEGLLALRSELKRRLFGS